MLETKQGQGIRDGGIAYRAEKKELPLGGSEMRLVGAGGGVTILFYQPLMIYYVQILLSSAAVFF